MDLETSKDFSQVIEYITTARENALRKVNEELIMLYWNVGKYISFEMENQNWGDAYVDELAKYISKNCPGIKGFNRRGLYRMKQFYEAYRGNEFVSPLVTQISWTNHILILSATKTIEERVFYINLCIKERYSKRELERQLDSAYYERYMLSKEKLEPIQLPESIKNNFLDNYVLEFLDLPDKFSESDFQKAITANIKKFVLELGKDFTFIGEEYRVQVGGHDYYIDLLFYHRGLACLVAFELKIGAFKPEYVGKINFYLEALDREVKKENENPSVGIILCASKDDEVVEFALSRSLSPTLVSEYTTQLIDKNLLKQKLHEFMQIAETSEVIQSDDKE
ncbi:PDDEXK nuclease domain-containing protein [Chakrabartyella piscis]|uniref:PDDEXK nuclease domain-containing protein n=1 Tax=Chakrabartyella piscis TaxID=2918914 RepID=UPI002958AA19|nr:PDDEXK nuclease domain-containing protein [Chakrabartyella piscis]